MNFNLFLIGWASMIYAQANVGPQIREFGPFEPVVSYIGLLAIGWFFWRRETQRTDKSIDELKKENTLLKEEVKKLQRDIRALLQNRTEEPDKPRKRPYFGEDGIDEEEI